jgi:hypothetical protein
MCLIGVAVLILEAARLEGAIRLNTVESKAALRPRDLQPER